MKICFRIKRAWIAIVAMAALICGWAHAEARAASSASKQPAVAAPVASPETHALTAEDLGAFFDGIVPQQLQRENIAGAVVLVVKGGNVVFQKGYGYADVDKKKPVTPDGTLFRPGSISKLFTWTAVMQQVEQGKIDLDRDINDYLDFKIPPAFGKPITMRNLLTHTPGFEEAIKDLIITKQTKPVSIGEYLRTHQPSRVYAPGTTPAYSNYGATLAGYIVERVSGMPFDDYVDKYIFGPLQMTHTTFRQPLPSQLQPLISNGYQLGTDKPKPFELIWAEPAGSSSTSAADIAHFMFAHLNNGEWNGARILKQETVAQMHTRQDGVNPGLPHMALGFYEETRNGHRIIGHGGDTQYFHSDMHLIQDANIGFFVSYNSAGRGEASARTQIFNAFLDRYLPYAIPTVTKPSTADADAKLIAGDYISSRRPVTNIMSFFGFLSNAKVIPGKDGTITIDEFKNANQVPKVFEEIGPLLYREKDGQDLAGFTKDSAGRYVLAMDYPFMVWTKTSLFDNKTFNIFLIIFIAIVVLLTVLLWPLSAWLRKHYKHPLALTPSQGKLRLLIRIVALIDLAYLLSWVIIFVQSGGDPLLDASLDPTLRIIQIIGWIGTLGTIVVLFAVIKTWKAPGEWWLSHLGNMVIVLGAVSFSWFLFYWHLLHFSLNY